SSSPTSAAACSASAKRTLCADANESMGTPANAVGVLMTRSTLTRVPCRGGPEVRASRRFERLEGLHSTHAVLQETVGGGREVAAGPRDELNFRILQRCVLHRHGMELPVLDGRGH